MGALEGKVALVTGASTGIGRATALLFAAEGARVVVTARRKELLDALVGEIAAAGGEAVALAGDIGEERHAKALVELARSRFDGLHVAFNNAATVGPMAPTADVTAQDWEATLRTNLSSAFFCAKYQAPEIERGGSGAIVFTSTFVGHTLGLANLAAYAASKAGVIGLARALAAELGPRGVRVNALLPGGTDTPMGREVASTPEARSWVAQLHSLKRIAAPAEIARAALFLASDASSFVNGSTLYADGGVTTARG